ncbi:MAG: nitric oxide synthase [Syntrophaceae bacterium]|nr:nitric oxide synthase [Syntrophaceae bacterium]
MKAAILYWSKSGNTEKVARAIREGLEASGARVDFRRIEETGDLDWFGFDWVCVGFPSYQFHPPEPVVAYLKNKFGQYRQEGRVKLGCPRIPGKHALIFCTYSGPHTGISEAIPAGKYAGQFFDHLGFEVEAEWYVVGEFHGKEDNSTKGRLGDIRGKPTPEELQKIKEDTIRLVNRLK